MRAALASNIASANSLSSKRILESLNEEKIYCRQQLVDGQGSVRRLSTEILETEEATSEPE
jgi:hypothetical protein